MMQLYKVYGLIFSKAANQKSVHPPAFQYERLLKHVCAQPLICKLRVSFTAQVQKFNLRFAFVQILHGPVALCSEAKPECVVCTDYTTDRAAEPFCIHLAFDFNRPADVKHCVVRVFFLCVPDAELRM